ncbi:MAG: O-antigen ligase family protein, partial [Acidimicrobiales bacterium]
AADEDRAEYRAVTLDQIEAHPLTGVGFNFAKVAHNVYLQVLASAGVIGLLGFLGVAALVVAMAIKTALPGPQHDLWPAGMIAAYVAYLAAGVVSNLLWDRWLWVYLSLAVAVSATSCHPADHDDQEAAPRRRIAGAVGAGSA